MLLYEIDVTLEIETGKNATKISKAHRAGRECVHRTQNCIQV